MTLSFPSDQKQVTKIALLPFVMVAWIVGVWGYMVISSSSEREFLTLAHQSLLEYFFVTASLLVAPVIGGSSAVRLLQLGSREGFPVVIAWLLLVLFVVVFSSSCIVCWEDYQRYTR